MAGTGPLPGGSGHQNVRIFDLVGGQLSTGDIAINGGYIVGLATRTQDSARSTGAGWSPSGFIDAHVHIEQPGYAGRVRSQRAAARHHNGRLPHGSVMSWVLPASSSSSTAPSARHDLR
jgi:hypothetical protein